MADQDTRMLLDSVLTDPGPDPPPDVATSHRAPRRITIPVLRDHVRSVTLEDGVTIYHVYPTLAAYVGSILPSATNPRSHHEEAIQGAVPQAIHRTITTHPSDFYLANRGITLLAQAVEVNTTSITVLFTDYAGPQALHGIADGGTTDLVIAREQQRVARRYHQPFATIAPAKVDQELQEARVHLEIIVGLEDRTRIRHLVAGRNTSRQVTSWSLLDFQGGFAWLKEVLEDEASPVKGKIGYEQNALEPVSVMDVLALLSLFHPFYNQVTPTVAPTMAYSARGKLDRRLMNAKTAPGYRQLTGVIYDILRLYDTLYLSFPDAYTAAAGGRSKSSQRRGSQGELLFPERDHALYLTNQTSRVTVPQGLLYPLLAAFRILLEFPPAPALAQWDWDPFVFLTQHSTALLRTLLDHMTALHNNPQSVGKAKSVYLALADRVRVLAAPTPEKAKAKKV